MKASIASANKFFPSNLLRRKLFNDWDGHSRPSFIGRQCLIAVEKVDFLKSKPAPGVQANNNTWNFPMKTLFKSLAILACSALFLTPASLRAQDDSGGGQDQDQDVSFQTFYDQLGDQGTWIQTDDYGYVFQPNVSDADWEPYTDGSWVDSDAGFTWVSDEPWGWATYHYGRWANIDGIGWVWVPGYRWAPAWVSWRYGGGYCGWAPLPPETLYGAEYGDPGVSVGFGFHFGGDVDVSFDIGPGCYNFIRVEDMGERNYRGHFADRHNNYGIINHTTNITNINVTNNFNQGGGNQGNFAQFHGIRAGGPPLNEVNAHARQHIQTVQFATSNQPGKSTLQGNTLAVFAPRVNPNSLHQAHPGSVAQTVNHPTFNRGDSITKPLEVTRNIHATPPSPEAIHAAEQAQASIPATAKIATPGTQIRTTSARPLTSLAPVIQTNPGNPTVPHNPGAQNFNNVNPNGEHHAGGSVNTPGNQPNEIHNNPPQTFHPQTQPENQGNPNVIHNNPPQTFHPQTQPENQGNPNVIHNNPPQTFHPQTQPENQGNPSVIHNNPPQMFHPQTQPENQGNPNIIHNNPPQTFHQEEHRDNGGNQPPPHFAPAQTAPPVHTQNPGNNGGIPPQNQGGGNGGGHPSGDNGKKDDKKPQGQ
jgi:hypothetical protein